MSRTLAIGDIHGSLEPLELLASEVGFGAGDTVVVLGDMVDRGPDSKGVIDFLIELGGACEVVPLKGNHEIMMENARRDRTTVISWMAVGGEATIDSYGAESMDDIPEKHWRYIAGCRPYFETDSHLFVHAGVDPGLALEDQPDYMLYWERFDNPAPHRSGKVMVCGHTSQKSGDPVHLGHAICIDTFAWGGGWLSCLDVDTGRLWRANRRRELRVDSIEECRNASPGLGLS